jgi:hypothetical protein
MDNEKKQSSEKKPAEGWWGTACCGPQGRFEAFPSCCEDVRGASDCHSMMDKCMKGCRWLPLVPVVIGVLFLLLGYHLDAEVTRVLWMILPGLVILAGVCGLWMMRVMRRVWGG